MVVGKPGQGNLLSPHGEQGPGKCLPSSYHTPYYPTMLWGPDHHHLPFQVTKMTIFDTQWGGERCPHMVAPHLASAPTPTNLGSWPGSTAEQPISA